MKQAQRISLHILFWIVILYWRSSSDYFGRVPFEKFIWRNLLRLPIIIVATYTVIYYLMPKLVIQKKQYLRFSILVGLIVIGATYFNKFLLYSPLMEAALNPDSALQYKWMTDMHFYRNSFLIFSIIGIASLIRFFKFYTKQELRKSELIQENLETQYAFLKAQVNPHFLFNALNNIYSMAVQKEQKEIAQGLEDLSGIMHYLTYESNDKKVSLAKEIALIKNYIAIEQLRFDDTDDTTISFNVEGDIANKLIAPVLLLPLVENAFKHGIKPDHTCLVSIKLLIHDQTLKCHIKNTVFDFEGQEIKAHGVGLENVKKRLNLQYPDQYSLHTKRVGNYYLAELEIDLKPGTSKDA